VNCCDGDDGREVAGDCGSHSAGGTAITGGLTLLGETDEWRVGLEERNKMAEADKFYDDDDLAVP